MPSSPEHSGPVNHRALLFVLVALVAPVGWAQSDKYNPPIDRAAPGKADQAVGARILTDFRRAGIAGDYWLSFELRVMPRQGTERTVSGTLLGMRGESGPLSRLTVGGQQLLIASGPKPGAWIAEAAGQVAPASPGQAVAGTGVTIFDLQMPFLYWTDFTYEGQAKVRGRPTHSFILRPPPGYVPPRPDLTGVRVLIDAQFQAMVQAELLGARGTVVKTIILLDLKKVGEQWTVKTIDVRDVRTRDKTRLTITNIVTGLHWPAGVFEPGDLVNAAPVMASPLPGKP